MLSCVRSFLGACRGKQWSRVYSGSLIARRRLSSEQFIVRRLQTADEVAMLICKAADMGRKPGALDHVSYFAADKTGFYVGELNGKVICCVSAVKYSDDYAFIGHYMVDKSFRGRSYGTALLTTVLSSLPEGCNLAGDVIEELLPWYESKFGVVRAWRNQHVTIAAVQGSLALSGIHNPSSVILRPTSEVPFARLLEYDTSVHAYPRALFLEKWISAPNCYSFTATNGAGEVVGYTVVRTILNPEDGWKIGPLFADDAQVARCLYKTVFEKVAAEEPRTTITVSVPFGDAPNADALQITKELSARLERTTARMYRYGIPPNLQLQKTFALTSSGL